MYNPTQVFGDQFKAIQDKQEFEDSYWIKWTQFGQKVFGTFLGTFEIKDDFGNPVPCYKFRGGQGCSSEVSKLGVIDLTGKVFIIRGKKIIDLQMEDVVPGQVIGAVYEKDIPTKMSPAKSIVIHKPTADGTPGGAPLMDSTASSDPELEKLAQDFGGRVVSSGQTAQQDVDLTQPAVHPAPQQTQQPDPLTLIKTLALTKLPIATEENWKQQVMESTGLYLGEQNYPQIIQKLTQLN